MYHVAKYQGIQNFKPHYVLKMKYISQSKETLNIQIILSPNKTQLLQKTAICKLFS